MLSETQISALRAPFPVEALSADTSRGFELTSIKAAYVVERLNEVFGLCGCGWRYVHASFEWIEGEVLTEVALQFKVVEGGCGPVSWSGEARTWAFASVGETWSWPIFSPGGRRPGKGAAPLTDARKGAITDGLTKAASMIGVGHQVFKGLVRTGQEAQSAPARVQAPRVIKKADAPSKAPQNGSQGLGGSPEGTVAAEQPQKPAVNGNGSANSHLVNGKASNGSKPVSSSAASVNATTFWQLANRHTNTLDRAQVSALAKQVVDGKLAWLEAQSQLDDLIDTATLPAIPGAVMVPQSHHANGSTNGIAEKARDPLDDLFE